MTDTKIEDYPFPDNPEATGYCVFPAELEDDPLVLFHATHADNLQPIIAHGFKIPDADGIAGLPSVSFAKRSVSSLDHAIRKRQDEPGAYNIIAVRYETLDRKGLSNNVSDIHDYTLQPPPHIIGYCSIPETYEHS